jgi:hypothetical protein
VQQRIDHALEQIGVSVAERQEVGSVWNTIVARGLAGLIVRDLRQTHQHLGPQIDELGNPEGGRPAPPDAYRQFLVANNLLDETHARLLDDYQHFWRTGEVRHPEDWPVGYHP